MLPMAKLKVGLESLKLTQVQTYIQSGNVVFQAKSGTSASLTKKILDLVEAEHGFRPQLILLTAAELRQAVADNPYPDATSEPKSLHFFFLATVPKQANMEAIEQIKGDDESYQLIDKVFYLHRTRRYRSIEVGSQSRKALGRRR